MSYNPLIHHRRSIRLREFDYSKTGSYFITLICRDRHPIFGHIQNGIMCLNEFGSIAYQTWLETTSIRPNVALGDFIIMPNHMHGIVTIKEKSPLSDSTDHQNGPTRFSSPKQTVGAIVRGYKGAATKRIKEIVRERSLGEDKGELQFASTVDLEKSIWQRNYYENVIRDKRAYRNISKYIRENPSSDEGEGDRAVR